MKLKVLTSSFQVKMMEIFDVTETDPSLLVMDNKDDISASLRAQRSRHCSAPSSVLRRGPLNINENQSSLTAASPFGGHRT